MLKYGPYASPPVVIVGSYLPCQVRGVVEVVELSKAPIPWSIGELDGKQALVVYRGLVRALWLESPEAVADAFGVTVQQVNAWKRKLPKKTTAEAAVREKRIRQR